MSISDILIRSISGYVFVIPGLLLYFEYLKRSGKGQASLHIAAAFVFCYYLIGVLTMTGIHAFKPFSPRIVLIPFRDMIIGPVNDLITNTVGACLGYCIYKLLSKLTSKEFCVKFQANRINAHIEVLLFELYSFVIMVTIQPFIIRKLFRLG